MGTITVLTGNIYIFFMFDVVQANIVVREEKHKIGVHGTNAIQDAFV